MKLRDAIATLKQETMACWWPGGSYPGKEGTDWAGILGEARTLQEGIKARQDIPENAMFYVMDDDNPETALYNKLGCAYVTVIQCMQEGRVS